MIFVFVVATLLFVRYSLKLKTRFTI